MLFVIWSVIGFSATLALKMHSVPQGFASSTLHLIGNMAYQRLPTIMRCVSAGVMP